MYVPVFIPTLCGTVSNRVLTILGQTVTGQKWMFKHLYLQFWDSWKMSRSGCPGVYANHSGTVGHRTELDVQAFIPTILGQLVIGLKCMSKCLLLYKYPTFWDNC